MTPLRVRYDRRVVNDESLNRANRFLAAVAERIPQGEFLEATPAEIGKTIGLPDPLSAARAVRALLARRRLEAVDGKYRLLDPRPVESGEPEAIPRAPRRKKSEPTKRERAATDGGKLTYSGVGHAVIDRLIDLGREVGTLRGNMRTAREETRQAREDR